MYVGPCFERFVVNINSDSISSIEAVDSQSEISVLICE